MANRFIGGVLTSQKQPTTGFVSRASTGTYFNSSGVLTTAAINQPRLNYSYVNGSWTQPTVLIEPASTNIVTGSSDFSNVTYWSTNNSTIATAAAVAPDGTTTACKIQETTANTLHGVENQLGSTNGLAYTLSIFAKAAERSWLIIDNTHQGVANYRNYFNLSTGATGTIAGGNSQLSMVPVGNGWYRCSVTRPAGTYGTHRVCIYTTTGDATPTYTGTSGSGIYIWGCQLEYQLGTTSFIPVTSVAITRAQDDVGPISGGIYRLEELQNQSSIDDQYTIQSFVNLGSNYNWTCPQDVTSVEVLVVGGGGSGADNGAGGGAGGVVYNSNYPVIPGNTYTVVVGSGGSGSTAGSNVNGTSGQYSQFGTLVANGGGFGGSGGTPAQGAAGGSGGGSAALLASTTLNGGPGTAGQGFSGGQSYGGTSPYPAGGGGGAGGNGGNASGNAQNAFNLGGQGGVGLYFPQFSAYGASGYFGGGGGGGGNIVVTPYGVGGLGGGGSAGTGTVSAKSGATNTGGGGGGGVGLTGGGAGGSGVVLVRYKRTNTQLSAVSNESLISQKFITSNYWTCPPGVTQVEALVVAGGGGGGGTNGGGGSGGGAGGLIYNSSVSVTPGTTYQLIVGNGGPGGSLGIGYNGYASALASGTEYNTNYSFSATTGWSAQSSATVGLFTGNGPNGGGSVVLTSTGGSNVYSTFLVSGLTNGTQYVVSFWAKGSSNFSTGTISFTDNAYNSGNTLATATSIPSLSLTWSQYSFIFTANSSNQIYVSFFTGGTSTNYMYVSQLSVRATIIGTIGGGGGAQFGGTGNSGGSGGGGTGGVGSGTSGQGNSGGLGYNWSVTNGNGGGGGAGQAGPQGGTKDQMQSGCGGNGLSFTITGNLEFYAGGGGGGTYAATSNSYGSTPGVGGAGGGGNGSFSGVAAQPGAPNTGGGGGGCGGNGVTVGAAGGSGVIVLRYRVPTYAVFQDSGYWTCPLGVTSVQALVVGGGGPGGPPGGAGGGAGGLVYSSSVPVIPGQIYSVVVGVAGGTYSPGVYGNSLGSNGGNSSFAGIVAYGGGAGGGNSLVPAGGGSGGGASGNQTPYTGAGGTYGQGNAGGTGVTGTYQTNGGGGGAGSVGGAGTGTVSGAGGAGLTYSISGTSTTYAGGGGGSGGSGTSVTGAAGGSGGGGAGGTGMPGASGSGTSNPSPGLQNTGGGGGGLGNGSNPGERGGSGIVIIRWNGG